MLLWYNHNHENQWIVFFFEAKYYMHQVNVKRNARSPLVLEKYSRSKLNVCIVYTYEERDKGRKKGWFLANQISRSSMI